MTLSRRLEALELAAGLSEIPLTVINVHFWNENTEPVQAWAGGQCYVRAAEESEAAFRCRVTAYGGVVVMLSGL